MNAKLEITFSKNEYDTIQQLKNYFHSHEIINANFESFGEFINLISCYIYREDDDSYRESYPIVVKIKD